MRIPSAHEEKRRGRAFTTRSTSGGRLRGFFRGDMLARRIRAVPAPANSLSVVGVARIEGGRTTVNMSHFSSALDGRGSAEVGIIRLGVGGERNISSIEFGGTPGTRNNAMTRMYFTIVTFLA